MVLTLKCVTFKTGHILESYFAITDTQDEKMIQHTKHNLYLQEIKKPYKVTPNTTSAI